MAKVTITLTDDNDGGVDISMEFDPPVASEEDATPAQIEAVQMVMESLAGDEDALNQLKGRINTDEEYD